MGTATDQATTIAEQRIMRAARRAASTWSCIVVLFDADDRIIGRCRRKTCDGLVIKGLLTEDQSRLNDEGRGDFDYVEANS